MIVVVVGIDVGIGGAIAVYDPRKEHHLASVWDMPIDAVEVAGKARNRVSDARLLSLLAGLAAGSGHAFIERPEGRPLRGRDKATGQATLRPPGAAGMLSLGESFGIVRCACTASGFAVTEIRPGQWKGALSVKAAKDDARRRAAELFPAQAGLFARVKDDGRAEAALMAVYGARILGKGR